MRELSKDGSQFSKRAKNTLSFCIEEEKLDTVKKGKVNKMQKCSIQI